MMAPRFRRAARLWPLALLAHVAPAFAIVELPVNIPYALVRNALAERVFTETEERIQVLTDHSRCNSLVLSAPRIAGSDDGHMRVLVRLDARGGTPLAERCVLPFEWSGTIELRESAYLSAESTAIAFRVVDSNLLDASGQRRSVPGVLWSWIKQYVHPRMEAFSLDLAPLFAATHDLMTSATRATPEAIELSAATLRLSAAAAGPRALTATIAFEAPYIASAVLNATPAAPLSDEELASWDAAWQSWDAFATWAIKVLGASADAGLRAALLETLVEARYELRDALAQPARTSDPVRDLFRHTWARLAPLLAQAELAVSGADALRYMAFVNAGDALVALDTAGGNLGVRLDQETLQRFARALLPSVATVDLAYSTEVDPALRELFGFTPTLTEGADSARGDPWWWLIENAQAAVADPALMSKLNSWVPRAEDLDPYIATMEALLASVAAEAEARGKIASQFVPIYRDLVRATAWQESCWRQYVERRGEIEPLRSSAGSVGLMQVNRHVWRGVYALAKLEGDVAYNARAGNEILVHYLVDYAIKKKEHEATGDIHNLARATYAVYNGGPGHLRRYRDAKEKATLKAIDKAFWRKYQKIRESGAAAVKGCYGF